MAYLRTSLLKLETNPKDVFDEAARLLIKIADNILKEPTNMKIRTLQKNNITICRKILEISGGLECLKMMGFEEKDSHFILPPSASLNGLHSIRDEIAKRRDETQVRMHQDEVDTQNRLDQQTKKDDDESAKECRDQNMFAALLQTSIANELSGSSDSLSSGGSISSDDESNAAEGATSKSVQSSEAARQLGTRNGLPVIPHDVPTVNLPPLIHMFSNPFFREVEMLFHMALAYADKDLHERAREIIPTVQLEMAAQKRLRSLQEQVKKGNCEDPNVSLQDMLILELLAWFKTDFFSWVDSPACAFCGETTQFSHMSRDAMLVHTERVEMHRCSKCQQLTPFPRYNDVNILLLTRKGRCGEWANTFTLLCCAMGWDARYVVDKGDHVWTEVYSFAQNRWLHCDPCENACDTPLIYENGWGKQLSYVIAYSSEEVQDVTWRYSSDHKQLLARRKQCTEVELVNVMVKLREHRQKNLSSARKLYLTKRLLTELIELMVEKKPNDGDKQGRTSGSLAWRLTRGEFQGDFQSPYCWSLIQQDVDAGNITIRYSAALDCYEYLLHDGTVKSRIEKWQAGAFSVTDVFRKEEKDWKMVYIARTEGSETGSISWKFLLNHPQKIISNVDIKFSNQVYENGSVIIDVQGDTASINFPTDVEQFKTNALMGSKAITVTARLLGGRGDVAWQHAQLFRQLINSNDYPFSVVFSFKSASDN